MSENKELINKLSQFVLDRRLELFEKILSSRTRYITVVLEDVFQPQNASAVLRSCDCFGIQDIHVIENRNTFTLDKEVTMGSHKWLNVHKYKDTESAIRHLKKDGYRIVATTPDEKSPSIYDYNLEEGKTALLFGTELTGLTDLAIRNADEFVNIPMYGFTESFNISVSVALILQSFVRNLHNSVKADWKLTEEERITLMLSWLRKTIRKADLIEKRFN